jgi:acetyl esterase/lipase
MRHTWLVVFFAGAVSLSAHAQAAPGSKTVPPKDYASIEMLWPEGQVPGANGTAYDDAPRLYCYPAQGPGLHAAVVVIPGGGYSSLVMGKEGELEAKWLNQHGISAYVLQYRISPKYFYPWPIVDGQRAVRFVRSHAQQWSLRADAIGVWGFSAGGHLAGFLSVLDPHIDVQFYPDEPLDTTKKYDEIDKLSAHPDFAILSYARLTMDKSVSGSFTMDNLLGPHARENWLDSISPVRRSSKWASPSFIYANESDKTVSSLNATQYFEALQRAGVPAELHIFERGPHGTGMGQNLPKTPELAIWPTLLENWLKVRGVIVTPNP